MASNSYSDIELLFAPFGSEDSEPSQLPTQNPTPAQNPTANPNPQADPPKPGDPAENDDDDEDDEYKNYSAKELRRIAKDLANNKKTAEQERDTFKSKVDEQDRSKRTDLENLQTDNDSLRTDNSTLRAAMAKLAIVNGIICNTEFVWHDPEIVAQQLDSNIVKVNDEGKVEGLSKELKRIAKDRPYLLKSQQQQQNPQQPTGFQPGQGGASQGGGIAQNAKELAEKYPALASRF